MDKIYILDASGYLYRSYFAIRHMTNAKGESTNALFGFVRSVLKLMKDFHPTHLVAVFDGPNNAQSRTRLYADYKAHRQSMPKDLLHQIFWAQEFCQLMGIPELMVPNVEADDTIGSVACWAANQGATAYLCTSDKDMCQLVNDRIFILNSFKDNQIMGSQEVEQQFGVFPTQMIDFLAITGDSSDNVPGLSGFGPKTAADLLRQFGSLDHLLAYPEQVAGKKKQETLKEEKEKALLCRRLVTIDTEVPFTKEEIFFKIAPPSLNQLREFYANVNFSSLLRELEIEARTGPEKDKTPEEVSYLLVDDLEALKKTVEELSQYNTLCVDTETTAIHPLHAALVGIGLGAEAKKAFYIPVNGKLGFKTVIQTLKPLLENPKIGFYGHNLKYDYHVLRQAGIHLARLDFDTLLASYLLNSHSRQHSLDHLSLDLFGKVKISIQDLIGKGKKQISMQEVPLEKVSTYCCEDVDYTIRLKEVLSPQLTERGLSSLFYDLELPLLPILAHMEERGIFVDVPYLKQLSTELSQEIKVLADSIYEMAGAVFNLNSPKQLSQILFDRLGIRPPKKTATGYSTNADVLETLRREYPIAAKLLEYRSLEKLRSTYADTLPLQVHPTTHRIHCQFNQSVAATGRLSCQDPNLQNIPVRTEIGRKIREAFRPQQSGWSYLSADYSQIELRLLAHLSEDPILIQSFLANEDIHASTAAQIFHLPLEEVTKEQRYQAKAVNFGIMYGQQAFGLSQELGIDLKTAMLFIQNYFEKYAGVKQFLDGCKMKARKTGKAVTLSGRERLIPEIKSPNAVIRSMAERLAVNTPIQGTQADLIKRAMLEVDRRLKERKLKTEMILQIHDELMFEMPDEELQEVAQLVHEAMVGVISLKIPLIVDIHIGKNWKEC